jgi:hypothetical protein
MCRVLQNADVSHFFSIESHWPFLLVLSLQIDHCGVDMIQVELVGLGGGGFLPNVMPVLKFVA